MKGCLVLFLSDTPDQTQVVTSQGEIVAVLNGGSHYLCRMARKGYRVNEVITLQRLEKALVFDKQTDLVAFFAENNPPAPTPDPVQTAVPSAAGIPQASPSNEGVEAATAAPQSVGELDDATINARHPT